MKERTEIMATANGKTSANVRTERPNIMINIVQRYITYYSFFIWFGVFDFGLCKMKTSRYTNQQMYILYILEDVYEYKRY